MQKTTHFQVRKQSLVTRQDVFYVLTLIAICLWFCLVPSHSLGQPPLGPVGSDAFAALEAPFVPLPTTVVPEPVTMPVMPVTPVVSEPMATPVNPSVEQFYSSVQSAPPARPTPMAAATSPVMASQYQPNQSIPSAPSQPLQVRSPQREVAVNVMAVNVEHPFRQYWGTPNDPQTKITGKPMTVAELFAGTRSSAVRNQLLQSYWELSGLLAIYHFRCEAERLASGAAGQQQDMMTLLREQRRTAEVEFIKQQWVLAEFLKQYKGRTLRETELPIPADYPLYPKYQTHANLIARTERTQYLGRMIPIQEQLIESKNGSWKAASEMMPSASHPLFAVSSQRTMTFLDLTKAIVDYNKMIAEYALETIPSNASQQQLVGAVVRLPRSSIVLEQPQTLQMATEGITLTQYESPVGITAQPVQQVGYESPSPPPLPSMPLSSTPEITETEGAGLTPPEAPAFLMDY